VQIAGGGVEQSIMLRGMTSAYTLFLIDGRPAQGNDAFSQRGSQAGTPISFLPPLSAIERIEVIRGPASALYSSDAMGAVINIITKKVGNEVSGSITAEYVTPHSSNKLNEERLPDQCVPEPAADRRRARSPAHRRVPGSGREQLHRRQRQCGLGSGIREAQCRGVTSGG
jgi:hypothetical protein